MTADPSRRAFLRLAGGTVVAGTVVGAAALVAARALEAPSNGSIGAMPRAFRLLGSLENVPLSGDPRYLSCKLVPGEKYRVQTLVKGAPGAEDKVGLVFFDGAGNGQGLGVSAQYGAYVYLRSGPGLYRTDRIISVD